MKLSPFRIIFTFFTFHSVMVLARSNVDGGTNQNILEVVRSIPYFSLVVFLIEMAQLDTLFHDESTNMMAILPINNAFLGVRTDLMIHFLTDQRWELHLVHFLKHHILHKKAHVANNSKTTIETFTDELVTLESTEDGIIVINSVAAFVEENVIASNGAIQAIDNVIVPTWYNTNIADILQLDSAQFSNLVRIGHKNVEFMQAISSSSWEPHTIFAPTNQAFSDSEIYYDIILSYHVVPGIYTGKDLMEVTNLKSSLGQLLKVKVDSVQRTLRINGNLVIQSNILANNGVVHIIEGLLIPSMNQTYASPADDDPMDIQTTVQRLENEHFNKCLFLRKIEETRGASEVECSCQQADDAGILFELLCRGENNNSCSPKYGECDTNERCCSNPLRRCSGGQCRDTLRPKRKMMRASKIRFDEERPRSRFQKSRLFDHKKKRNKGKLSF